MKPISIQEGQRFGRLTVVEEIAKVGHTRRFRCECDCEKIRDVRLDHLTRGKILSCGCYHRDRHTGKPRSRLQDVDDLLVSSKMKMMPGMRMTRSREFIKGSR